MAILVSIFKNLMWATFFLTWPVYSAVLKHESSKLKIQDYSYQDFCDTMKAKSATLISASGTDEIECFNQKFKIVDFCMQKAPLEKHITRGYTVEKEKKVYCEEAHSVMVSISCDARDMHFCLDPKKGCDKLKKIYAHRLEVVHYAMLEKNLNCYFSKPLGDNLNED